MEQDTTNNAQDIIAAGQDIDIRAGRTACLFCVQA